MDSITFKDEVYRKTIHIFSSLIPLSLLIIDKYILLLILLPSTTLFFLFDYNKNNINCINYVYKHYLYKIVRIKERKNLTGASWVFIASSITILVFNTKIAIISLLVMSLADSAAAIFGRLYG